MAGLVPAIHVSKSPDCAKKNVDAQHEAGHDDMDSWAIILL